MSTTQPVLKCETVCYKQVDYYELDKFIQTAYGIKEFSCVDDQEWNNNSKYTVWAEKEPLHDFDQKKLEEFLSGKSRPDYMLRTLLNDLCNKGLLEPGKYLIAVSW